MLRSVLKNIHTFFMVAVLCSQTLLAIQQDGTPDTTFQGTGQRTVAFAGYDSCNAGKISVDPNTGNLVGAGTVSAPGLSVMGVFRLNFADGSLDASFGTGGTTTVDFGGLFDSCQSLAIQNDSKIILVGSNNGTNFAIARLNVDGTLDATFGTGGKVTTAGLGFAHDVAIQSDGKIVVVGDNYPYIYVARYNTNGTLDGTFGTGGVVTLGNGTDISIALCVGIQTGGIDIIVVGGLLNAKASIISLNPSGGLYGFPSSYAGYPFENNEILDLQVLNQGNDINKVLFVVKNGTRAYVCRTYAIVSSGLDISFGVNGVTSIELPGSDTSVSSIATQYADQKIIVGGENSFPDLGLLAVRFEQNGNLDATFQYGAIPGVSLVTPVDFPSAVGRSIVSQHDRKTVLLAGGGGINPGDAAFTASRLNVDNTIDSGFGTSGVPGTTTDDNGGTGDAFYCSVDIVEGDIVPKAILAGGSNDTGTAQEQAVLSLYQPDSGVLIERKLIGPEGVGNAVTALKNTKTLLKGGSTIAGATKAVQKRPSALTRREGNTSKVSTYNFNDNVINNSSAYLNTDLRAVSPTPSKITTAGTTITTPQITVAQVDPDLNPVTSFGGTGQVNYSPTGSTSSTANAVTTDQNGNVAAGGSAVVGGQQMATIVTFDETGVVTNELIMPLDPGVLSSEVTSMDTIPQAGTDVYVMSINYTYTDLSQSSEVRWLSADTLNLDTSMGTDAGITPIDYGNKEDGTPVDVKSGCQLYLADNGKVVIPVTTNDGIRTLSGFQVLDENGIPDTKLSTNGNISTQVKDSTQGGAVAVTSSGDIYMVGKTANTGNDQLAFVTKYNTSDIILEPLTVEKVFCGDCPVMFGTRGKHRVWISQIGDQVTEEIFGSVNVNETFQGELTLAEFLDLQAACN